MSFVCRKRWSFNLAYIFACVLFCLQCWQCCIRRPCPPKRVTVPSTFHPLPSLLNVIESESKTDKTAHIRKRLHALASVSSCTRSQIARFPPKPPPHTHTHNVICAPPRNSNAPLMEVPWCRLFFPVRCNVPLCVATNVVVCFYTSPPVSNFKELCVWKNKVVCVECTVKSVECAEFGLNLIFCDI